jgi:hypothetical protein
LDPKNFPKAKRKIMNGTAIEGGSGGDYLNDQVRGSCMNAGDGPTLGLEDRDSLWSIKENNGMEWSEGWNVLARDFDQSFVCRFALSLGDFVPRGMGSWSVDVVGIECDS